MILECEKGIALRSITEADTENVLRWRNSDKVRRYFNYQEPVTENEHASWLEHEVQNGHVHQFIVHSNDLGKDIGSVYLKNISETSRKAEYGVFFGEPEAIGKGYGTIVAKAMIDYAFNNLQLHKLYLQVHATNLRAIKCYEKAGFFTEAVLKDHVFVNGSYCDIVIMSILNDDSSTTA